MSLEPSVVTSLTTSMHVAGTFVSSMTRSAHVTGTFDNAIVDSFRACNWNLWKYRHQLLPCLPQPHAHPALRSSCHHQHLPCLSPEAASLTPSLLVATASGYHQHLPCLSPEPIVAASLTPFLLVAGTFDNTTVDSFYIAAKTFNCTITDTFSSSPQLPTCLQYVRLRCIASNVEQQEKYAPPPHVCSPSIPVSGRISMLRHHLLKKKKKKLNNLSI
ncbi:uncharacterized protein G2W53_036615 [Senna tora]|uniref:Uncharacterized protein n=1 Tax=Senna tora TaxID=362788 RepID=A0A834W5A0_9FABA|nr:uncharacterized protein G2W53_036615 [Senna tora]